MSGDRSGKLTVLVAVLTRKRPIMLRAALESFSNLRVPDNCDATFLVVENDDTNHAEGVVAAMGNPALHYVLETEPGIPFARNRAAKVAIEKGMDLLAFIDDDEVVAEDWLVALLRGYRNSHAVLFGAPLRAAPPAEELSWSERLFYKGTVAHYEKQERRAARKASLHATPGVTIVTNNWLGETGLFRDHGIWFDEAMRFTGGTDTKFHRDVSALGLPTGWVDDAFVYETIPADRLTWAYQYARGRDQSNASMTRKLEKNPGSRWNVLVSVPLKMLTVCWLAVGLIPTLGGTALELARTVGWISGRIGAVRGKRSHHYVQTTGH